MFRYVSKKTETALNCIIHFKNNLQTKYKYKNAYLDYLAMYR